jgi:pyruvate-ferredoxin/flavodoxin oxidoreductase
MYISNATGCSSIYGGSAPSTPYCVNREGHGPAWENSLFEDAAEFGYGMNLAVSQRREKAAELAHAVINLQAAPQELKDAAKTWLDSMHQAEASRRAGSELSAQLEKTIAGWSKNHPGSDELKQLFSHKIFLSRNPFGFSAATDGPSISDSADSTMCLQRRGR